jgi:hypothetical protein
MKEALYQSTAKMKTYMDPKGMANATPWTSALAIHLGSGGPTCQKLSLAEANGNLQGSPPLR